MKAKTQTKKSAVLSRVIITGILALQLAAANKAFSQGQQNLSNLNDNVLLNVTQNINVTRQAYGGPNVNQVNINVTAQNVTIPNIISIPDNGVGPNGISTRSTIVLPKAVPVIVANKTPKPASPSINTAKPATKKRTVAKPGANPPSRPKVTLPKKRVQPTSKPVLAAKPVSKPLPKQPVATAPKIVKQPAPVMPPVTPVQTVTPMVYSNVANAVVENNFVQSSNSPAAPTTPVASAGGSSMSGSKSSSHHKTKNHGFRSFKYAASKKLTKLFAGKHKGKFDPAKCFVWG